MIRITPNFTLRRVNGQIVVTVFDGFGASVALTADEARGAAEAFAVMAVMLDWRDDELDEGA